MRKLMVASIAVIAVELLACLAPAQARRRRMATDRPGRGPGAISARRPSP